MVRMILATVAYLSFGALTALAVFAIESLPDYGQVRLTNFRIGVYLTIVLWPVLLIATTAAMLAKPQRTPRR